MSRETVAPEEVKLVAREYSLRRPIQVVHITRGSRAIAKAQLRSVDGDWMVKRRPASERLRIEVAHAFQRHLEGAGVPVAGLRVNSEGETLTVADCRAYELFRWVEGTRHSCADPEAAAAGVAVGGMLVVGAGFGASGAALSSPAQPEGAPEFDIDGLVGWMASLDPAVEPAELGAVLRSVVDRGRRARALAQSAGVADAPRAFVHGDLHAGNMLFSRGALAAIIDFDECRNDVRAREVATAALSLGSEPRDANLPSAWRHAQHLGRTAAFLGGVRDGLGRALDDRERLALPWLMIETCVTEAMERIAATGRFDQHPATDFLDFVDRKTAWIERHAADISSL
jgi:Ser/Thr protein kinase RdoA (MazF antagonist)